MGFSFFHLSVMDLFGDMTNLDQQGPVSTGPGRATRAVLFDEPGGVDLLGISDGGRKKVELVSLVDHHQSSDSSPSSCYLFWLEKPLGQEICGCLIEKQSVVRFCISAVSEGTNTTCSKVLHSIKSIKAKVVPQAWYVTTAVPGKGGGRATLSQKSIQRSLIP
jgi:hypothetical protein